MSTLAEVEDVSETLREEHEQVTKLKGELETFEERLNGAVELAIEREDADSIRRRSKKGVVIEFVQQLEDSKRELKEQFARADELEAREASAQAEVLDLERQKEALLQELAHERDEVGASLSFELSETKKSVEKEKEVEANLRRLLEQSDDRIDSLMAKAKESERREREAGRRLQQLKAERDELERQLAEKKKLSEQLKELLEDWRRSLGELFRSVSVVERFLRDPDDTMNPDNYSDLPGSRISMDLSDIMDLEGDPEAAMMAIRYQLAKYMVELRYIYRYYAVLGKTSVSKIISSFNLFVNLESYVKFVQTCGITDAVPLATCERIFTKARRSGNDGLLVNEFCEALVRLAHARYPRYPNLSARLAFLITKDAIPKAGRESGYLFRQEISEYDVAGIFQKHQGALQDLFAYYAQLDSTLDKHKGSSINIKEFLSMLKDCSMIDANFTVSKVLTLFTQSHFDDEDAESDEHDPDVINIETEMIFAEFLESLVRLADVLIRSNAPLNEKLDMFIVTLIERWAAVVRGDDAEPGAPRRLSYLQRR